MAGVQVYDLDEQLSGMKVGEKRVVKVTAPDTHPNEAMRGKEAEVELLAKIDGDEERVGDATWTPK